MLIINQERKIINSKCIAYIDKYYSKEDEEWSDYYVQANLDEFPDIEEYKTIWIIWTNDYGWTELGRYSSKEKAEKVMNELIKAKFFIMPKEKKCLY